jgi:hypothetical protein
MSAHEQSRDDELVKLDLLRGYKQHFGRGGDLNVSPFDEDRVVRYHTAVGQQDIPEIHAGVRAAVRQVIEAVHQGQPSQVVILAGPPGMGKSHLINYFRTPERAAELGYVLVCNSNHWKVEEFEECLLDWVLEALVRPSPNKPHLLLEKVEDVAFQALSRILAHPGQVTRYKRKGATRLFERLRAAVFGNDHARFVQFAQRRDPRVFRRLDFFKFSGYVCDLFLPEPGNPFHRYVLRVLLHYLFEEDREKVLHWLRCKPVEGHFLKSLGAQDQIDRAYKVIDTLKVLISLFTPEVTRNLSSEPGQSGQDKVFFFAFDQMEGRQELFEDKADWFKFFAQLSELYNALPNVFILFTMTLGLRNELYGKMETQFQQRIRRDQKFVLHEIPPDEILMLYRSRVCNWLGDGNRQLWEQTEPAALRYLPLTQEEVIGLGRMKTLRLMLEEFDKEFRQRMEGTVTRDPFYDYLVSRNELRREEEEAKPFDYTEDHLAVVKQVFDGVGLSLAAGVGLTLGEVREVAPDDGLPALRIEFRAPEDGSRWVRVFLVRLPFYYNRWVQGCVRLLQGLQIARYFLWFIRPDKVDPGLEESKPPQTYARELPALAHTNLRAVVRTVARRNEYQVREWEAGEKQFLADVKACYLGELLEQAREAVSRLQGSTDPQPATAPGQP